MISLIRHGKTKGNLERRYIGATDESLCNEGILELKKNVEKKLYPITDKVFSSPLKRCLETSEIIYPNCELIICNDLKEISFGDCEAMTYDEIISIYGKLEFCNGEDIEIFKKRILSSFFEIAKQFSDCVIICHGGVIMSIMENLFGGDFYDWHIANGCGYTIDNKNNLNKFEIIKSLK